ncbi:MAG: F0F1 ATP synthase subunit B [Cytophagales bacterium]|nr:F0F1 ATP synthase subunit B [Cytophagales bacterium]
MDLITPAVGLVFWTSLVFIVLWVLLGKFAWGPITKAIKDRESSIEESLRAAEIAREEMQQLTANNEKLLQEAKNERASIIEQANKSAKGIIAEAEAKANEKSAQLLEKAHAAIEAEKKSAIADMRKEAVSLSVDIAEKLLRKELSQKPSQDALLAEYVKDVDLTNL